MYLADFRALVRDEYLVLVVDEEAALADIPGPLPEPVEVHREACSQLRSVVETSGTAWRTFCRAVRSRVGAVWPRPGVGGEPQGVVSEISVEGPSEEYGHQIDAARDGLLAVALCKMTERGQILIVPDLEAAHNVHARLSPCAVAVIYASVRRAVAI